MKPHTTHLVFCDPEFCRDVAIHCSNCGYEWTENIPDDVYNAPHMWLVVACRTCTTTYIRFDNRWRRFDDIDLASLKSKNQKENINERQRQHYDA